MIEETLRAGDAVLIWERAGAGPLLTCGLVREDPVMGWAHVMVVVEQGQVVEPAEQRVVQYLNTSDLELIPLDALLAARDLMRPRPGGRPQDLSVGELEFLALEVDPPAVAAWLSSQGWTLQPGTDTASSQIWQLGEGARVMVPLQTHFADYGRRMAETLRAIFLVHGLTEAEMRTRLVPVVTPPLDRSTGTDA